MAAVCRREQGDGSRARDVERGYAKDAVLIKEGEQRCERMQERCGGGQRKCTGDTGWQRVHR